MREIREKIPVAILALNMKNQSLEFNKLYASGFRLNETYKLAKGSYKGNEERCYIINASKLSDVAKILELAKEHKQECFILLNEEREATKVFSNGKSEKMGRLKTVSESEALKHESWTYDYNTDQYFLIEEL